MEIENIFQRDGEMDALILAVLLLIKQNTLTETPVGLEEVGHFIYGFVGDETRCSMSVARATAGYIVRDILQNKGKTLEYGTVDAEKDGAPLSVHVRLIMDKETPERKIVYELTEQGYAFIFSTLENAQNMSISMKSLILREYLRLKNYGEAEQMSTQIYSRIQQEIQRVTELRIRIRKNLFSVEYADFASTFDQVCAQFRYEQQQIADLQASVKSTEDRIQKESESEGRMTDESRKALKSLTVIRRNLEKVYQAQVNLIGDTQEVGEIYEESLENSLRAQIEYRYDFQKEIMDKLPEISTEEELNSAMRLIIPFLKPAAKKKFQMEVLYGKQSSISSEEDVDDAPTDVESEIQDHTAELLAIERNNAHAAVLEAVLKTVADSRGKVTTKDVLQTLGDKADRLEALRDLAILYQVGELDLNAWVSRLNEVIEAEGTGEFDLDNALLRIYHRVPALYGLDSVIIEKTGETFTIKQPIEGETGLVTITEMDMLSFREGKEAK